MRCRRYPRLLRVLDVGLCSRPICQERPVDKRLGERSSKSGLQPRPWPKRSCRRRRPNPNPKSIANLRENLGQISADGVEHVRPGVGNRSRVIGCSVGPLSSKACRTIQLLSADSRDESDRRVFGEGKRACAIYICGIAKTGDWSLASLQSYLGEKFFATARAPNSSVSRAIFWANMTSPATSSPLGTKHQPARGDPFSSSSYTFVAVP